jgi:hypothetical protein
MAITGVPLSDFGQVLHNLVVGFDSWTIADA